MAAPPDLLVRAIATADDLRVIAAVTTGVVREASQRHGLSSPATAAIGRAITSGLLLATMTKGEERVTVQLAGDGPLGGVTTDATSNGDVRAYVTHPHGDGSAALASGAGGRPRLASVLGTRGFVSVVRDLGMRELYQGQVELATGEIDEDVERYLRTSEQVASALSCEVVLDEHGAVLRAAGVLVQALPGAQSEVVQVADAKLREGALYALLAQGDIGARELADALSPSHPLEFFADRPVRFQCRCSRERIRDMLRMLSPGELEEMIAEAKPASVTCNFCNSTYTVDLDELGQLLREVREAKSSN